MAKQSTEAAEAAAIEKTKKDALEARGAAVGFNPDARKSVSDMTADVEAAEKESASVKAKADEAIAADKAEAQRLKEEEAEKALKVANAKKVETQAKADAAKKHGHTHTVTVDSITSKRGILLKGATCKPEDFPGAEAQLQLMVNKKLIAKV